ncbi:hypothetical protein DFH29DRAFT_875334 [Suillus ampliporus]|nr:hypothetical protein DFH29DRAFT_875334 [Suillus ampliporus]
MTLVGSRPDACEATIRFTVMLSGAECNTLEPQFLPPSTQPQPQSPPSGAAVSCKPDLLCCTKCKDGAIFTFRTTFKLVLNIGIPNVWAQLPPAIKYGTALHNPAQCCSASPSTQAEPEKTKKRGCPPKEQPEKGLDWDKVKVKITEKLAECLEHKKPDLLDYELIFSVPWHQTSPIPLANEDDFNNLLLDDDTLIKKGNGKENNVGSDDEGNADDGTNDNRPKKKKKGKNTPDELPLNIEVAAHIKTLQNWWAKNPALVTVNQPPNYRSFDSLHDDQMAVKSPLLQ